MTRTQFTDEAFGDSETIRRVNTKQQYKQPSRLSDTAWTGIKNHTICVTCDNSISKFDSFCSRCWITFVCSLWVETKFSKNDEEKHKLKTKTIYQLEMRRSDTEKNSHLECDVQNFTKILLMIDEKSSSIEFVCFLPQLVSLLVKTLQRILIQFWSQQKSNWYRVKLK